ncbi:septal ring lytic transglycosylase RlpA family protein [Pantanalinema rosaneae CENA516]|uniref:septal ring lytic transglycosylase RlpA family protein n=1 Tax=Pantanalinema rosaneae TaxID=1620701 RepID=UPI003D6FEA32
MNRKLLSGLTATLLIATMGTLPSLANPSESTRVNSEDPLNPTPPEATSSQSAESPAPRLAATPADAADDVVKIGEQTPQSTQRTSDQGIAKVHPHQINGQKVATLYVRNIPILTFVGSAQIAQTDVKMGTQIDTSTARTLTAQPKSLDRSSVSDSDASLARRLEPSQNSSLNPSSPANSDATASAEVPQDDPVWRATEIAAKINQLNRDGVDANTITVSWDNSTTLDRSSDRYLIKVGETALATIDRQTILPDTTRNLEVDALQATNRLRRILGNADPLQSVSGKPAAWRQPISLGPLRIQPTGMASWYGPGFNGNRSASGEIFNQNALTAAHRTLPFGTRVQVTNLDNGQSVIVRINDRGPFHGNRIIDLSMAAARVLGLLGSGVAPVRLDVVNQPTLTAGN